MKEDNLIGVLMMVKNEENNIAISINSFKKYIKHVIIYDTGSIDKTIDIITETCKKNNQILYLKQGTFKSFPESRNESLCFADTVNVKYLILMDAGDEFKTDNKNVKNFYEIIKSISPNINFGLVKQRWKENNNETNDHNDLRFIRNKSNCRYDLKSPVHETFLNVGDYINLFDIFILYQDRVKYGGSTKHRYIKDIETLLKAPKNKRNYYFLAQSYMSVDNYKDGFKYNVLSLETEDKCYSAIDEAYTCVRAGYCSMMCHFDTETTFKYLFMAIDRPKPPIDAYIYIMKICIDNKCFDRVLPHVNTIYNMKKPTDESTLINHGFWDYTRYNLLSIITLMTGKYLDIGYECCKIAVKMKNHPDDCHNIKIFEQINKKEDDSLETRIQKMINILEKTDASNINNDILKRICSLLKEIKNDSK